MLLLYLCHDGRNRYLFRIGSSSHEACLAISTTLHPHCFYSRNSSTTLMMSFHDGNTILVVTAPPDSEKVSISLQQNLLAVFVTQIGMLTVKEKITVRNQEPLLLKSGSRFTGILNEPGAIFSEPGATFIDSQSATGRQQDKKTAPWCFIFRLTRRSGGGTGG